MENPPVNQDELALVERVFLRIGSAETDEQLQNALTKFLPPVLLKLSSTQEGVRKKVMELLVHVNKRLKSRPVVQLPVETLLLQYQDPAASSFLKNFTVIYVKMGFPRLEPAKQAELAIPLLLSIEDSPTSHQDSLLSLVTSVLATADLSNERGRADIDKLKEKPAVLTLLLDFILDLLLLPYGVTWPPPAAQGGEAAPPVPPPGLSEKAVRRALGDQPPPPERLERLKAGLVRFLSLGQLPAGRVAPHLLVAMADTRFTVANLADMELRRLCNLDWEDPTLISQLCSLYLGTLVNKNAPPSGPAAPPQEQRRQPVGTRIRLKLLPYLCRSKTAATMFPQSVQVMFDSFYGTNTNPKLKLQALQFIIQIIQHSTESRLAPLGPMVLGVLHSVLAEEKTDQRLRSTAYTAIGRLGQKLPAVISRDLNVVRVLFDALEQEESETGQFVQDTLQLLGPSLRRLDDAQQTVMEALLGSCLERPSARARQVAVQYAAVVFPESHAVSRLQLLLATADSQEEVAAEALKHLKLDGKDVQDSSKASDFPDFAQMITCITRKISERESKKQTTTVGNNVLPFPPTAFAMMIRYLSLCLQHQAAPDRPVSTELVRGRAAGLGAALQSPALAAPVETFLALTIRLLRASVTDAPLFCLLETVAAAPGRLAPLLADQLDWLKTLVCYPRETVRGHAAELYGVVAAAIQDDKQFGESLRLMHQLATSKVLEEQHGGMLGLAQCLARRARENRPPQRTDEVVIQLTADLLAHLESSQPALQAACLSSVSELGRTGPLPVAAGPADQRSPPSLHYVVTTLLKTATSKKLPSKMRERAIVACGLVCVGDPGLAFRREIVEHFLSVSSELDELELQMAVGEALVGAVLGPQSPEAADPWRPAEPGQTPEQPAGAEPHRPEQLLTWLLRQLLENQLTQTHPKVRQSAAVWLLALVKHCQHLQRLKDKLADIQAAFMELLASGNDLVQEAASKGLALVYDSGDEQQRATLVDGLVGALTGSAARPATQKVTADTKLFAQGELGKDPSGGQLSTYKELCSLASDLNQPDLIYKFMTLVNHNAAWNSRRGAAFGFSSIASKAGEALTPHLANIVPKLYRYQFDPKPQVQQTMRSIWSSIVPESTKTVQLYLPQIMDEVLARLTDGLWRVRESCCAALAELLCGAGLDPVLPRLPEMWSTLFRVRDDIKESVRLAANKTLEVLSRVCVRLCEQQESVKTSEQTLTLVLPVLLETGLASTVREVRAIR
ncbi:proteasome adapter and scaffold protein ECM29-like [Amphibalanus amphitrite]|uniref:proteasome adapter and scaffold protein ECM29-like n=1 Tax=Amphibalanus amphitrite TaxID=1232801 RepID=UPI001C8FFDFD|nr:proteasome adapter and scaffold protein ECM29-like [Amphibalanus amphitrite]